MRILQIIQKPQLRGAEIFASQLSNHLLDEGHEVKMIALLPGEGSLPFRGELIRLDRPLAKRFFDWQGWRSLAKLIKEFNPDIVQSNAGDTLKFAILSKLVFGWRNPVIFRNANKISDFLTTSFKLYLNKFLVNRLSFVISVSELCRSDFQSTFSFPSEKIACIPIGIEQAQGSENLSSDGRTFFRNRPVYIHVGSFVREKNHEELLEMFRQLIPKFPDAILLLVGEGPLKEKIKAKSVDLQLEHHVHFLGARKDVMTLVKNANAFLLPSLIEGLPGVILESFYVKTPVVAYNVGGISEVVRDGQTGFLINAGDRKQFVNAAAAVVRDGEDKARLTENAFSLVTTQYNNKSIANRFTDIYMAVATVYKH